MTNPTSDLMTHPARHRRGVAIVYGLACHGAFALAGAVMAASVGTGLTYAIGPFQGPLAIAANVILLAQFPTLHSWLLTKRGRALLARFAPHGCGETLATTTYALIASLQLILVFIFWSPSGVLLWRPEGAALALHLVAFAGSWALLAKAAWDAGIQLQTGALGWLALYKGGRPKFPDMPETGLFKFVRQPIYLAFALALWTGPIWTLDKIALASIWSAYCYFGPRLKERRFHQLYGARFDFYKRKTPYWLPIK